MRLRLYPLITPGAVIADFLIDVLGKPVDRYASVSTYLII
jgi:hypothetical protein